MQVVHFSALKEQGGAARVARILHKRLSSQGVVSDHVWEVEGQGLEGLLQKSDRSILHIHSCLNWLDVLKKIAGLSRVVITAHDCSLITGGCVYPLQCEQWKTGCEYCERGFVQSHKVWQSKKDILFQTRPLIVSPSKWLGKMVRQFLPEFKIKVIPNGIEWDEEVVKDSGLLNQFNFLKKYPSVLFVAHGGTKAVYKGGSRWEDVWQKIAEAMPEARALFVGGDKIRQERNLYFLPYLPQDTLYALMQSCSVLAYPTVADNHPLIVLEAMRCRLPVVAFNVGGIGEQIVHGETGILINSGNWDELAQEVVRLLKKRRRARFMADTAFERGKQFFSASRMVSEYIKIYAQIDSRGNHAR
ncbi:glycosyltransferase [Desulfohalobiaceae bacterium Ax17]|uniref:glycosyltransferase n=1 Tax=Desulfovulcanus ferrireducens TaxID=2831190 RepID=UPI00207BC3DE|nr:glycosyltransferase [Desulfovulcanus ferrireducens]MBT8764340.1 glycosyltransferase [Desulfovulcanus ferrireducens]